MSVTRRGIQWEGVAREGVGVITTLALLPAQLVLGRIGAYYVKRSPFGPGPLAPAPIRDRGRRR